MTEKKESQDPRFYYVRIINIQAPKQKQLCLRRGKYQVKLQLGTKESTTNIDIFDDGLNEELKLSLKKQQLNKISEEAHIFKYGAEEFMNIFLEEAPEHELGDKQKEIKSRVSGLSSSLSGFSRILLPPLIEHPHICHEVVVPLIGIKDKQDITGKAILQLTLEIYYQLDFRATLDIIPLSATIGRNMTQVGDIRPVIVLSVENQVWTSLDTGGIHPHWSGHYHARRQRDKDNPKFSSITNINDNIEANRWSLQQRHLSHDCNLSEVAKQAYFDIARFELRSAGSYLQIRVYEKPFKDISKATLVGSADIRIQNSSFFKHPRDPSSTIFTEHQVDIFEVSSEQVSFIGKVHLDIRFIFNKEQVLDPKPFVCEMPSPKVELHSNGYRLG